MANPTEMEYFARNFSAHLANKNMNCKAFVTSLPVKVSGATASGWLKARWMPGVGDTRAAVAKAMGQSFERLTQGYCVPGANKLTHIKDDGYAKRHARMMRGAKKKKGNGHDTGLDALTAMEADPKALEFKLGKIQQLKGDEVSLTISVKGDFFAVAQFATALHRVIE